MQALLGGGLGFSLILLFLTFLYFQFKLVAFFFSLLLHFV